MNDYQSPNRLALSRLKKSVKLARTRRQVRGALRALVHARHDGLRVNEGLHGAQREHWGEALPPFSNTGVTERSEHSTTTWAGIHWFAGTARTLRPAEVCAVVAEHLEASVNPRKAGGYGYHHSAGIGKASVYWSVGRADVFVVLPGEVCEQLALPGLVALATELDLVPSSRLDVAWDNCPFTPRQVARAFEAGDVVTRIKRSLSETGRVHGLETRSNAEGDTTYLGSRSSERFVRVYDRRGATRFEMELKGKRSIDLWARFMAASEEMAPQLALGVVRDFIDFKDRCFAENTKDCPMLPWWASFTDWAGKQVCVIPRRPVTLEKVRQWLKKAVAGSLAAAFDCEKNGSLLIRELMTVGRAMYHKKRERVVMVADARRRWELAAQGVAA